MADTEGTPESSTRRKKIASYLKAANDIRQSYQQSYTKKWENRAVYSNNQLKSHPEFAASDLEFSMSGEEKLVIFPSYAKRHSRGAQDCGLDRHYKSFDIVDESVQGKPTFGSNQLVVDVDVRGWIYVPHKGLLNRKSRLFLALVRQFSGIPAPKDLNTEQYPESRSVNQKETELLAAQGKADKSPAVGEHYFKGQISNSNLDTSNYNMGTSRGNKSPRSSQNVACGVNERTPWKQPSDMSPTELTVANSNLMTRLSPFMANPLVSIPVNLLFYNEKTSVMRTVKTNEYGHFTLRAALEFIPSNVKVSVSDWLSVEEEVKITEPRGVSLISDIDDTIKYTSIGSGAREVFLNAFVRDLGDLTIDGVKEWYNSMYKMGVDIHYVSNSPWQFFPTLINFFRGAGLPPGSYHLKHYSGVLQGVMEPVSERKKPTITKILSDFPDRCFILVGDSGEADLEVYSDIVLANPGRILMVLIRDLTHDFFDSASIPRGSRNVISSEPSVYSRVPNLSSGHVKVQSTKSLNTSSESLSRKFSGPTLGKLIDISDDEISSDTHKLHGHLHNNTENRAQPPRPPKPAALQAPPCTTSLQHSPFRKRAPPPPPPPRSRKSNISLNNNQASLLSENKNLTEYPNQIKIPSARPESLASSSPKFEKRANQVDLPSQNSNLDYLSNSGKLSESQSGNTRTPAPSVKIDRTSRYDDSSSDDEIYQSESLPANKKLDLWRRRWRKAKQIFDSEGVILKAWKVGSDASEETLQVIKKKMDEIDSSIK